MKPQCRGLGRSRSSGLSNGPELLIKIWNAPRQVHPDKPLQRRWMLRTYCRMLAAARSPSNSSYGWILTPGRRAIDNLSSMVWCASETGAAERSAAATSALFPTLLVEESLERGQRACDALPKAIPAFRIRRVLSLQTRAKAFRAHSPVFGADGLSIDTVG